MKKIVALLLCLVLVLSAFSGCGGPKKNEGKGQLIIGSTTDVNGDFFDGWTNGAQNAGIKVLIHGNDTVAFTRDGTFQWNNTVVKNHSEKVNDDGSKTYTIELNKDLYFSDGTQITAADYVLYTLLASTEEYNALDGVSLAGQEVYVGYDDFKAKKASAFSGIRLLDKFKFSATVKAAELPYHYDITYAAFSPMPTAVIIPGLEVKDDGKGVYVKGLTNELLQKTMLDPKTGYRFNPQVTSGPYKLMSFDAGAKEAVLEINEFFKGMYDGTLPSIQKLIFKLTNSATEIEELGSGLVDLIVGVTGGDSVEKAMKYEDDGKLASIEYGRNGFGYLGFACNFGPSQFVEVRQAITYLMDRVEFAKQFTGGYGIALSGNYGLGQGEYLRNKDWLKENLNQYTFSIDKAIETLVNGGWTYDAKGGDYKSGIRHKKLADGTFMPLVLKWNSTTPNPMSDQIATCLTEEIQAKAGLKIERTNTDFSTLLDNMTQSGGTQEYHMYNLAVGFVPITAHWYYFDPKMGGEYNKEFLDDKEIYEIALGMKTIAAEDTAAWDAEWKKLQKRWNYLMPSIPLYSNIYYDFFNKKLTNYSTNSQWTWYYDMPFAKVA